MNRTKITAFITFTALSAFLLVLSFTPLAGGETRIASALQKSNGSILWGTTGPAAPGSPQPDIKGLDITGVFEVTFAPFLPSDVLAAVGNGSVKQFTSSGILAIRWSARHAVSRPAWLSIALATCT